MTDIMRKSSTRFASEFGSFELTAFEATDGGEHLALVAGRPDLDERPLVRVQSSCLTGTAFHALLCDCRQQLETALEAIAREGSGCLLYLAQEGRGHGLVEKVNHLAAIGEGADTVDAALLNGVDPDVRDYAVVPAMLRDLLGGLPAVRLMTNNPEKLHGLERSGLEVVERVAIETPPTPGNIEYLRVKKARMGHLLERV